ncbi:MAG TPA: hypothetical protein VM347_14450 [Nonomuraea sp.]|nr:hypothetical protein [Nonomuraea sp.]
MCSGRASEPLDVLIAAHGAAMAALDSDQVERLLNYLLDALRTRGLEGTEGMSHTSIRAERAEVQPWMRMVRTRSPSREGRLPPSGRAQLIIAE